MALGTKDLLIPSDEHDSDRSLQLNMLLCQFKVLCSVWWSLSKILLSATVVRHSSSVPTTAPTFLTSHLYTASPAHHSIKEETGNNRLVKHVQEFVADIEGQPPQ